MSKLTDDLIDNLYINGTKHWIGKREIARAVEAIATEPLLQRIEELEQRNRDLYEDVQRFREHAMNEKAARMELERQLEEARKDAERYRWLRLKIYIDPKKLILRVRDTYLTSGTTVPEMLDNAIDAAMQKGQS